jgi:hypothetical protein
MVTVNICNALDMAPGGEGVNPTPQKWDFLNISKTIEIPTLKLYVFLFLVLQAMSAIN